jgi:hypothetical protein
MTKIDTPDLTALQKIGRMSLGKIFFVNSNRNTFTLTSGKTAMQQLFSIQDKKVLSQNNKLEKDLQQFICENWKALFPQFTFIAQEFQLKGAVHGSGSSGRIDILAFNPATKRFVFFELKKDYGRNIGHQAANYRQYIHKNFNEVYLDALQKHKVALPDKSALKDKEVEMILIAKEFFPHLIEQAEPDNFITLIEYNWFENDLVLLDYVHAPDIIIDEPDAGGSGGGTKEPYKGKAWDYIVERIQKVSVKKALQAVTFPPTTTEQHDQLKVLVEQVPGESIRTALQKRLEALETQD